VHACRPERKLRWHERVEHCAAHSRGMTAQILERTVCRRKFRPGSAARRRSLRARPRGRAPHRCRIEPRISIERLQALRRELACSRDVDDCVSDFRIVRRCAAGERIGAARAALVHEHDVAIAQQLAEGPAAAGNDSRAALSGHRPASPPDQTAAASSVLGTTATARVDAASGRSSRSSVPRAVPHWAAIWRQSGGGQRGRVRAAAPETRPDSRASAPLHATQSSARWTIRRRSDISISWTSAPWMRAT